MEKPQELAEEESSGDSGNSGDSGDSLRPHSASWPKHDVDAATKFGSLKEILERLPVDEDASAGSKKEDLLLPMKQDSPKLQPLIYGELKAHQPESAFSVLEREEASKEKKKKKCCHCEVEETVQWRKGPNGLLCNACGMRYKQLGKLDPEYRPANSPTFSGVEHSNYNRVVKRLRQEKYGGDGAGGSSSNSK